MADKNTLKPEDYRNGDELVADAIVTIADFQPKSNQSFVEAEEDLVEGASGYLKLEEDQPIIDNL